MKAIVSDFSCGMEAEVKESRKTKITHVLICKCDELGDFLTFLPAVQEYAKRNSNHTLTMVIRPNVKPLAIAAGIFHKVVAVPAYSSRWQWRWSRLNMWRKLYGRYDIVIDATLGPGSCIIIPDLLKYGIKYDYSKTLDKHSFWPSWISDDKKETYLRCFSAVLSYRPAFNVWQRMNLLLGNDGLSGKLADLSILLKNVHNPLQDKKYWVWGIGAGALERCWPAEKFAVMISRFRQKHPFWDTVLLGGENEFSIGKRIEALQGNASGILNCCGNYDILTAMKIITQAQGIISNETSLAHVGAAANIPTIIIGGGGHYGLFIPYPALYEGQNVFSVFSDHQECFGCNWQCTRTTTEDQMYPCVKEISVEKVWAVLNKF